MYKGFLALGGTEIANAARFVTYANELVPSLEIEDCWGCTDLAEVLGDEPYNTPIVDQPDWFSPADRDSWEFCGFYPLTVEGIDDGTRTSTVTELTGDGAVLGAPRYGSREIRVTGILLGATDAAVQYGLRWLAKALEGSACRDGNGCTGDHLCYYAACPPMCTDSPALDGWDPDDPVSSPAPFYLCDDGMITTAARACSVDYERTLYQVTLTSGPAVTDEFAPECGAGMLQVEFTLVAGVPFAFSTAVTAAPGQIPVPQVVDEQTCTPGGTVVVRENLATNPVPTALAANLGGGWQVDPDLGGGFTATLDTAVEHDPTGTASVRIERTAAPVLPNLATNPGPTTTLDGWGWQLGQGPAIPAEGRTNLHPNPRLQNAAAGGATASVTATNQATGAADGRSWRRLQVTAATTADIHLGHNVLYEADVADPTTDYTVSSYALRSAGGQVRMFVRRYDTAGVQVGADIGTPVVTLAAGAWTRSPYTLTPTQLAGVASLVVRVVFLGSKAVGETLGASMVLIEEAGTARPYFDGSNLDGGGIDYAWTGTAGASTSTATPVSPEVGLSIGTTTGDGPGGSNSFMRATVVHGKVGGEDGPTYTLATGPGMYAVDLQVRTSDAVDVRLAVTAFDADGLALQSASGPLLAIPVDTWSLLGPVTITAPAGTVRLRVAALIPGGEILAAGETFDAGAVRIYSGLLTTGTLIGGLTYVGSHDADVDTIAVSPGAPLTVSTYVGSSVDALAQVTLHFYTAAGLPVSLFRGVRVEVPRAVTPVGVAQWRRPSATVVVPANAAAVVIDVEVHATRGVQVGDRAWVTSALVEETTGVLSYFDGSTTDQANVNYQWTGTAHRSTSQAVLTLPAEDDGFPVIDPDCPAIDPPPRPPVIEISCVSTPATWTRYVVDVPEELVPVWFDAVPVIRLSTGDTAVKQVRVRFYPNPLGAPMAALDPCSFCGEFVVTYIPPGSTMLIDGIRQWTSVTFDDGRVATANHLLSSSDGGPVSWPLLGCGVGYSLVVDVSPTSVSDLTPQICLAARA